MAAFGFSTYVIRNIFLRFKKPTVRCLVENRAFHSTLGKIPNAKPIYDTHSQRHALHVTSISTKETEDVDWRSKLTEDQFRVCRERATEMPNTGKYNKHFEKGMYRCVCCGAELFSSETKYDSGSGWPSFHTAHGTIEGDESGSNVGRRPDHSGGRTRTEVVCKKCDSHLGHVFEDGPQPIGLRFCINSVSLDFAPKKSKK